VIARRLVILAVLVFAGFAAWLAVPSATTFSDRYGAPETTPERVARGEYLARVGNCATCHTAVGGPMMAGGLEFVTPFGTLYSTNITPDPASGIGAWTFADFANSMRHGVRPDGTHLYPVFPYTAFTGVSDDDLAALYAYLRSIPAVARPTERNALRFPFAMRPLMKAWKALYFDPGPYRTDDTRSARWNRGAYLVETLAHCDECHSPRNVFGAKKSDARFAGGEYLGRVQGGAHRPWFAPNLTPAESALGNWPIDDLVDYLATGRNAFLETFGPMNEVIMNSTRHLREEDLRAMADYLYSLPPIDAMPAQRPDERIMGRGRTIYNLHCGTCHLPTALGDPEMAPRLNRGSLVVQAANPASMINVILYSPEAPHPPLPMKWRNPMDEFRYLLDDEEIAALASYVRHSWDNSAGAVTAEQVARQR
jgi:mono/diheme cytochrome c family protein